MVYFDNRMIRISKYFNIKRNEAIRLKKGNIE